MSARPAKGTKPIVVNVAKDKSRPYGSARAIKAAKSTAKAHNDWKEAKAKRDASALLLTQDAGFIEAEDELERTYRLQQDVLRNDHLDLASQAKLLQLDLPDFGPYRVDFTRSGRHMLFGGKKGHVAAMDWKQGRLMCEVQLKETVRDVCWLHNETMFAVAQKDIVFIYDHSGTELHALRKHRLPHRLTFLPYHFLLASIGDTGVLVYQDTSTGTVAAELPTKLGKCSVMTQNPWNAVIHTGHANGIVTMWSPTTSTPLVKMLTHKGALTAIAVDPTGRHMATSGVDGQVKLWDLRHGFKPIHSYFSRAPATDLAFSQRGLLAVGWSSHVHVWKDVAVPDAKAQSPYLTHQIPAGSKSSGLQFVPFEDVLAFGHDRGVATMVVPGAGEPNFDALEANPYATAKQRREHEVKQLLDKLPADTISLDPSVIGAVVSATDDRASRLPGSQKHKAVATALDSDDESPEAVQLREKKKISGLRKYLRKQTNVIDAKKQKVREELDRKREDRERRKRGVDAGEAIGNPLDRFRAKQK
ncbi:WD40-repeat-containing domain protein [Catenaria anguillulae PL171]|uniref:U three protein 7 n=1 Tax=Catenaria anguillulae PL171 TaxID=765915 RepID=A0A1Y2HQG6_9FUNG|nr:WD40-repeat-containing domain protein [Catenaria anguillulae PL171]